jgi:hypothetical protein
VLQVPNGPKGKGVQSSSIPNSARGFSCGPFLFALPLNAGNAGSRQKRTHCILRSSVGKEMVSPTEHDFETQVLSAGVNVFFRPTNIHYSFIRLSGQHTSRFGQLSRAASIRHHGPTRDTGDYDPIEVLEMAYQLASAVAGSRPRR